jgi:hypothetical protein
MDKAAHWEESGEVLDWSQSKSTVFSFEVYCYVGHGINVSGWQCAAIVFCFICIEFV